MGQARMDEFIEQVPDEYREAVTSAGIKDLPALVANWREAQEYIGQSIRIPQPNAAPEQLTAFEEKLMARVPGLVRLPADDDTEGWSKMETRLGVPAEVAGYKLPKPEGVNDELSTRMAEWFAKEALTARIPARAAQVLWGAWTKSIAESAAAETAALTASEKTLREDWGAGYDQRMAAVGTMLRGLTKAVGSDANRWADEVFTPQVLAANPDLAKLLGALAVGLSEDVVGRIPPGGALGGVKSASELKALIEEGKADPAYLDRNNPRHKQVVERVRGQFEQLHALQMVDS